MRVLSLKAEATFRKHVFRIQLESDKSVYFCMPFIASVKHHHALCTGLKLICGVCPLALIFLFHTTL